MINSKSIYNFIDKASEIENEDAICTHKENNDFYLFSAADGAGGVGIYCKDWAIFLAENQPANPFLNKEAASEWFLSISELFYEKQIKVIDNNDDFIREKFYDEGSYSTILYCWLSKKNDILYYSGLGDTTLFIFSKTGTDYETTEIFPINLQSNLDDSPKLLNWKTELKYDLSSKSASVKKGDILIISTDALSRRIIYQLFVLDQLNAERILGESISSNKNLDLIEHINRGFNFNTLSNFLNYWKKQVVKGDVEFMNTLKILINTNELEKDDYSIIRIEI